MDEKEAVKVIEQAVDIGYHYFDTAGVMTELIEEGKILHWGISETAKTYLRKEFIRLLFNRRKSEWNL